MPYQKLVVLVPKILAKIDDLDDLNELVVEASRTTLEISSHQTEIFAGKYYEFQELSTALNLLFDYYISLVIQGDYKEDVKHQTVKHLRNFLLTQKIE